MGLPDQHQATAFPAIANRQSAKPTSLLPTVRWASDIDVNHRSIKYVNNLNHYEMTVIYNGALEDDQITQLIDRTTEFITRNGGQIKNADHWGRRRLAYPINKKNNGYYIQWQLEAPGEIVRLLERFFHIEENIIRHLILQMSENDLKDREDMKSRLAAVAAAEELAAARELDGTIDEDEE
jgi:small subunit ribosomal protein S6